MKRNFPWHIFGLVCQIDLHQVFLVVCTRYSEARNTEIQEQLRNTIAILFYIGSCKPFDRLFVKFIGECIAGKLDYKNDLGEMKFKKNKPTKNRGNGSDTTEFIIPVPKTENFCNWREQ